MKGVAGLFAGLLVKRVLPFSLRLFPDYPIANSV